MQKITCAILILSFLLVTGAGCIRTSSAQSSGDDGSKQGPTAEGPSDDNSSGDSSGSIGGNLPGDFWSAPEDRAPRFLFVHHSTGSGFMFDGGMAEMLEDAGFEVHSRTYGDGWVGDNTDPVNFPQTFTRHFDDLATWDLPDGVQYDIIAFKSCFPASNICSDEMLGEYKGYYETIKSVTRQHPEILFIAWSTPPLVPGETESHCAARASEFADWLSGSYTDGETNLVSYDLFHILAGDDSSARYYNCLKSEYQNSSDDSHPNHRANAVVAADFTEWLRGIVGI